MLYRGNTPLTPEECFDYETGRQFHHLRQDGLVLETTDCTGRSVWTKTLRGFQVLNGSAAGSDSRKVIRITIDVLDSSC
jgi:hypothetical protein